MALAVPERKFQVPVKDSLCAVVLVCGVSDSGKTSVLGQLVAGKALETVTSMIENR